jgi:hypothetical protein
VCFYISVRTNEQKERSEWLLSVCSCHFLTLTGEIRRKK